MTSQARGARERVTTAGHGRARTVVRRCDYPNGVILPDGMVPSNAATSESLKDSEGMRSSTRTNANPQQQRSASMGSKVVQLGQSFTSACCGISAGLATVGPALSGMLPEALFGSGARAAVRAGCGFVSCGFTGSACARPWERAISVGHASLALARSGSTRGRWSRGAEQRRYGPR